MHPALDHIALVVFDLDGTLIDSAPDLATAVDAVLGERGLPPAGVAKVRDWVGNGTHKLVERALTESEQRLQTLAVDADTRKRFEALSPRESEVLKMLLLGRPNRRVAKDLGIAEKTVEAHRAHIMEKIGASSFAELVTLAVQSGFQLN